MGNMGYNRYIMGCIGYSRYILGYMGFNRYGMGCIMFIRNIGYIIYIRYTSELMITKALAQYQLIFLRDGFP